MVYTIYLWSYGDDWGIGEFILILWFAVVGDDRHHILFILVVYTNQLPSSK